MTKAFSRIDGWPVAVGIVDSYQGMAAAFQERFGVALVVTSGIRTYTEQVAIFTDRYRIGARSPYGDYRWWNGSQWGRVSGAGTVAQPGTSNHETGRSLDLADTGADAGVASSFNSERNQWLSANCWRWGFTHTGRNFREPWHFEQLQVADPFLGRGKPTSISPSDPGELLYGGSGAGGVIVQEDEMNSAQEKKLDDALRYAKAAYERAGKAASIAQWLKGRIKGSVKQKSITTTASEARDAAQWLKGRVKGSTKNPSITAMLEAIQEAVVEGGPTTRQMIADRAAQIELTLVTDADVPVPEVDEPVEPITDEV